MRLRARDGQGGVALCSISADEAMNAVAGDGWAAVIKEYRLIRRAVPGECKQLPGCGRPQGTSTGLAALATYFDMAHGVGPEIQVLNPQARCLRSAGAGVVEKQEQGVVAPAEHGVAIRCGEERVHLRLFQVGDFGTMETLKRNSANRSAPCDVLGAVFGNESKAIAWIAAKRWLRERIEQ